MKAIRNLAALAAVALMFATFGANRAHAQTAVQGTFKLPFQLRWGSANLPPGSYRFEVRSSGETVRVLTVWSQAKGTGPVRILGLEQYSLTAKNELLCQRLGSVCIVRRLRLGVADETLTFPAPKSALMESQKRGHGNHARQVRSADAVQTVPITTSGK